jgi:hypothetical protein
MEVFAGFEWDDANRSNCQKHGVPIAEIEAVFQGRFRVAPDTKHSDTKINSLQLAELEPVCKKRIRSCRAPWFSIPGKLSSRPAGSFTGLAASGFGSST